MQRKKQALPHVLFHSYKKHFIFIDISNHLLLLLHQLLIKALHLYTIFTLMHVRRGFVPSATRLLGAFRKQSVAPRWYCCSDCANFTRFPGFPFYPQHQWVSCTLKWFMFILYFLLLSSMDAISSLSCAVPCRVESDCNSTLIILGWESIFNNELF